MRKVCSVMVWVGAYKVRLEGEIEFGMCCVLGGGGWVFGVDPGRTVEGSLSSCFLGRQRTLCWVGGEASGGNDGEVAGGGVDVRQRQVMRMTFRKKARSG